MGSTRRRYTAEFKAEAVRLVATSGKSLTQLACELGRVALTTAGPAYRDRRSRL